MCSFANIRAHVRQILHLNESPHRTALAFALGAFIAFSPTYFFHTVTVVFCTWAFRLNFLALMAGALINNPWTLVPILSATFWTGFRVLGIPDVPPLRLEELGFHSLYDQVLPYAVPFFVGGFVLSVLAAVVTYPLAYVFIAQYRARIRLASREPGPLPPQTDLR